MEGEHQRIQWLLSSASEDCFDQIYTPIEAIYSCYKRHYKKITSTDSYCCFDISVYENWRGTKILRWSYFSQGPSYGCFEDIADKKSP